MKVLLNRHGQEQTITLDVDKSIGFAELMVAVRAVVPDCRWKFTESWPA